ncbi:hypothetical protein RND81_09G001800 [Saponaria officinalis]|uniref:Interactor of constitutive active ROPs 4 n=1 Tax=Saponaria officinalis TaxID=3572 RepID=A0AAW1IFN0_SAPOF
MPRTRGVEVPQRPSPAGPTPRGPRHLRTSSSDSDPLHQRPLTERSPRIMDRRSPRITQSDPANQKKLGTRITDLETQLVQAQHELKSLKHQLTSAKKQAQEELNKKPTTVRKVVKREKPQTVTKIQDTKSRDSPDNEVPDEINPETDVFEVPVEKLLVESKDESSQSEVTEAEKPSSCDEVASKNEDIDHYKAMVEEKEKEKQVIIEENQTLKQQLEEAKSEAAAARTKEEELAAKMTQVGQELAACKANEAQLKDRVLDGITAKESLENEMKRMKVQTEQWRKAADAAAAVLAGGVEINGRMSDRCASMDNHFNGIFEPPIDGYGGYLGSMGGDEDNDDGFGREKKRSSGIRMFGELWKKKGQK